MADSIQRVASRYLGAARDPHLDYWGLEGLLEGKTATLYHGTTRLFTRFSLSKSRDALVNQFYGPGIFLTPKKSVAGKYADANRNIGFDPDIIKDLKRVNSGAGEFLETLYKQGPERAWARVHDAEDPAAGWQALEKTLGGVNADTLGDIATYIIGTKVKSGGQGEGFVNIFSTSTGMPDYIYDMLDEVGLKSFKYRPKVYTATVRASNVLVTASKSKARKARTQGYDCVIYYGSGLVDDVPEVAVFKPSAVTIKKVEEW